MESRNNLRHSIAPGNLHAQISQKYRAVKNRLRAVRAWFAIVVLTGIGRTPRSVTLFVGKITGNLFYRFNTKRRRFALTNLEFCFPHWPVEKREKIAKDHFRCYGQAVIDMSMLWLSSEQRLSSYINYKGFEHWVNAQRQGRPVIFLTPHVVSVDFAATLLSSQVPTCAMMKDLRNSTLNKRIMSSRSRFGLKLYERSRGIRPLIRNLLNNVSCVYIPDQDFGMRNSVFASFFGEKVATLATLGRMAKLTNALVLPLHSSLNTETGQYYVVIDEPLSDFPTNDPHVDARRMNAVFETIIAQAPEQYMWTLRWFKTRPNNGPSIY